MTLFYCDGKFLQMTGEFPTDMTEGQALDLSIEKWEVMSRVALAPFYGGGTATCALCYLFYEQHSHSPCGKCPVYEDTGMHECDGTPYWTGTSAQILEYLKGLKERMYK